MLHITLTVLTEDSAMIDDLYLLVNDVSSSEKNDGMTYITLVIDECRSKELQSFVARNIESVREYRYSAF